MLMKNATAQLVFCTCFDCFIKKNYFTQLPPVQKVDEATLIINKSTAFNFFTRRCFVISYRINFYCRVAQGQLEGSSSVVNTLENRKEMFNECCKKGYLFLDKSQSCAIALVLLCYMLYQLSAYVPLANFT